MGIGPFERLKPDAGRLASPVLRGRGIGNALLLPDFLNEYDSPRHARERIRDWFVFYNTKRPHQSLDYQTPWEVLSKGNKPILSPT
ncbi:MAG: integrase core domain-containing protein [Leptospirillum sp.]